jgi:hypothetical protein
MTQRPELPASARAIAAAAALAAALAVPAAFAQPAAGSAPATASATLLSCDALDGEIARVEQARRAAQDDSDNAWKAVVPFVVLARKASAKSAQAEAERRLAELNQARQRCGAVDGS